MNELTLNVKQNPGVIELNFDEIEKALDAKLAEYKVRYLPRKARASQNQR